MSKFLRVCGPKDKPLADGKNWIFDVTSGGDDFTRRFSPMILGPVELWGGFEAKNVENAWQFSKVYEEYVREDGEPTDDWIEWAEKGWNTRRGIRYPMGKNAIPEYSYWNGHRLDYIEARKKIYAPLYSRAVLDSGYLSQLVWSIQVAIEDGITVWLFDYDGYDHKKLKMDYTAVLNNPKRKMGHAFVLAQMIERRLNEAQKNVQNKD